MNNKHLIIGLLTFSIFAYSQELELDKEYLDSLPSGVREDVLNKIKEKEMVDKPLYRSRPSTTIDKTKEIPLYLKKKEPKHNILNDSNEDRNDDRFGTKFFKSMQTSFMPINEPNFDSSYVVDFGDILELQLIGQKELVAELEVNRDGSINLPDIGKVYVSGLSLESLSSLIKEKVKSSLIGTEAFISLVNIRDIQILISGNAYNPGIYTLNGNSNLIHALSVAGGVGKYGSYRNIEIIRNNESIASVDLYDLFIHGKSKFGPKLRTGDSIFVNTYNNLVNVSNGVKRPGKYELKVDENFTDLVNFANGLSDSADTSYIAVERFKGKEIELIQLNNINELSSLKAKSGDNLFIGEYNFRTVDISGAVKLPGKYVIVEGDTLSNLIKRAGGYTSTAYPYGGYLNNKKTFEINMTAKDKLYNRFIENIISSPNLSSGLSSDGEGLYLTLEKLKNTKPSGRIIAEFDMDLIQADPTLDTLLSDEDEIIIPHISQQVYVYGQVNNPGSVRYMPGKSIQYYINKSGGSINLSADFDNIFVVDPNGASKEISTGLFKLSKSEDIIYPGSIIYIPRSTKIQDPSLVASIWAPIISSLALSITSISLLEK